MGDQHTEYEHTIDEKPPQLFGGLPVIIWLLVCGAALILLAILLDATTL